MGKIGLHLKNKSTGEWDEVAIEPNGSLPVTLQDQVVPFYRLFLLQEKGTINVKTATVVGSYDVVVENDSGTIAVGDYIEFGNGTILIQAKVLSIVSDTLTLDRFWAEIYQSDLFICRYGNINMAGLNGATTPIMFNVKNLMINSSLDITQISVLMIDASAMSIEQFGGLGVALTRGMQIITDSKNSTVRRSGFNIKTNGELMSIFDKHEFTIKAGGGQFGIEGKKYLGNSPYLGAVIRLNKIYEGGEMDSLEIWIQDNLTGLVALYVSIEGSAVVD